MKNNLQDFEVNIKIKLAGLWAAVTLCYLYGDYFELYTPKKVEGLMNGNNLLNTPTNLLLAAVLLAIPAVMVALSLTLKPLVNKWLNVVFGLFFTAIMLFLAFDTYQYEWYAFYVFLALVESVITSFIVWSAWNWQKETT
jgi:ABC-type transport system involved in cytochrome c biogenesis permease subunit